LKAELQMQTVAQQCARNMSSSQYENGLQMQQTHRWKLFKMLQYLHPFI